jgi:hypothetical protein
MEVICWEYNDNYNSFLPDTISAYNLYGSDDSTKITRFAQFCQSKKYQSSTIYEMQLPVTCSYGMFVRIVDILHINGFYCGVTHQVVRFSYQPQINYQPEYKDATLNEEYEYLVSQISEMIDSIQEYFTDKPVEHQRILKYTKMPYSDPRYGDIGFINNAEIKNEPRVAYYFRTYGLWFIPILLLWLLLGILSIIRSRKLLPNQALKLTE